MFDTEREQIRKTYQLCRFGFGSYGAALLVAAVTAVIDLLAMFRVDQVRWIHRPAVVQLARHAHCLVPVDRSDSALGTLGPKELAAQNEPAAGSVRGRHRSLVHRAGRSAGPARR